MGIDFSGAKGGGGSFKQRPDTLRSNDTFEGLLGLCAGPILGPTRGLKSIKIDGTPIEDESGTLNFQEFTAIFADGDPTKWPQIAALKLGAGASPVSVGVSITNSNTGAGTGTPGPWVTRTLPNTGADFIDLRFIVSQLYRQDKKGIYEAPANLEIEMKPVGTTNWINPNIGTPSGTYKQNGTPISFLGSMVLALIPQVYYDAFGYWRPEANNGWMSIYGKTTSPYVHELRIAVPNEGAYAGKSWDVRVRLRERESLDADPDFEKRTISWESLSAGYSTQFGSDPGWRGVAWLQAFGKASDQLTGVPEVVGEYDTKIVSVPSASVFNPTTRAYTGVTWNGTYDKAYTNDPAWVINDAISDGLFGISAVAPGCYLNKWDALELSKWCSTPVWNGDVGTEPRYSLNLAVDQPQKADEFIQYLAGAVGALAWDDGDGQWRCKVDKPEAPVALFTLENIEGEFSYAHTDVDSRFNDITMSFRNAEMDYREDRVRIFDQAHIDQYGRKPTTLVAVGSTGRQETARRAMLRLRSATRETRIVSFVANRQGRMLSRWSTILVADGDLGYKLPGGIGSPSPADADPTDNRTTGRIVSIGGGRTAITLRDTIRLEIGVAYKVHITVPNPAYNPGAATPPPAGWMNPTVTITRDVTNIPSARGDVKTLNLNSAIGTDVPANANIALEAVGLPTTPKLYRVTDIEHDDDGERIRISAIEIDTGKWDAADNVDPSAIALQKPDDVVPPPLPPVAGPMVSVVQIPGEQVDHVNLIVNWQRPPSRYLEGFRVSYRLNGGPLIVAVERTQDTSFEMVDPAPGFYEFEVVSIDRRGAVSAPLKGLSSFDSVTYPGGAGAFTLINRANMQITGTSVEKVTGGGAWGNASVVSGESFTGGATVTWTVPLAPGYHMFMGLSTDPLANDSYETITYAIATESTSWTTRGVGVPPINHGAFSPGDRFAIQYVGTEVVFMRNNVVVRRVPTPLGQTLWLDSSFHTVGARATDIVFSGTPVANPIGHPTLVAHANVAIEGNSVWKIAGGLTWDASAYSREGYAGGAYISWVPAQTNRNLMVGLNSDPETDAGYVSIDHALYCHESGQLYVYESGVSIGTIGTYVVGDTLAVHYTGSQVRYLKNGTVLFTRNHSPTVPLYLDTTFHSVGGRVNNLLFSRAPIAQPGVPGPQGPQGPNGATGPKGRDAMVYRQDATPTSPVPVEGDIWYRPTSKELYRRTGGAWERLLGTVSALSIITEAYIDNLSVGSAKIKNLNVETIKIANNGVTASWYIESTTSIGFAASTKTLCLQATITKAMADSTIEVGTQQQFYGPDAIQGFLYTEIYNSSNVMVAQRVIQPYIDSNGATYWPVFFEGYFDGLAAGTYSVRIYFLRNSGNGCATYGLRHLRVREFKR